MTKTTSTPSVSGLGRRQLDGLVNDVRTATDQKSPNVPGQPIVARVLATVRTGLSKAGEAGEVDAFVGANASRAHLTEGFSLPQRSLLGSIELLQAQKAVASVRFNRPAGSISELTVKASGSVKGAEIAPRELFVQRWRPTSTPNGNVVVIAPGYMQSGRDFHEQANLLNQRGYDVLVMDQQWAGYSEGEAGKIDRGFGIARDVAAVMARAATLAKTEYGGATEPLEDRVLLAGTSMGGGAGGLGFLTFNDSGEIALGGEDTLPKGLSAVLQSPFFAAPANFQNAIYQLLGKSPARDLKLNPLEVASFVSDPSARQKVVNRMNEEKTQVRPSALLASNEDLATLTAALEQGQRPKGLISVLAASGDPIASFEATERIVGLLNAGLPAPIARLKDQGGADHIANEVPGKLADLATALDELKAAQRSRRAAGGAAS